MVVSGVSRVDGEDCAAAGGDDDCGGVFGGGRVGRVSD